MRLPWQKSKEAILTEEDLLVILKAQNALNEAQIRINVNLAARVEALEHIYLNEAIFKHVDQRIRH